MHQYLYTYLQTNPVIVGGNKKHKLHKSFKNQSISIGERKQGFELPINTLRRKLTSCSLQMFIEFKFEKIRKSTITSLDSEIQKNCVRATKLAFYI